MYQLCRMAKPNEKQLAYVLYVDQCLTAKEIAKKLSVSEKSVGKWVDAGNWKTIRLAKQTSTDVLLTKHQELQAMLLDKRIKFERNPDKNDNERKEQHSLIDEMSKVAAVIDRIQKDGKVSLRTHVHCIEKFMAALNTDKPKLFMDLIEFQTQYLTKLADDSK